MPLRRLSQYKLKTDICLKDNNDDFDLEVVKRQIRQYRVGMSSLNKLKIKLDS
jgi:hypothetical protein